MPRLSIVIPCAQDAERFETTLASVLQNRPGDCELLLIQPRSYDDPYELADEVHLTWYLGFPKAGFLSDNDDAYRPR